MKNINNLKNKAIKDIKEPISKVIENLQSSGAYLLCLSCDQASLVNEWQQVGVLSSDFGFLECPECKKETRISKSSLLMVAEKQE